MEKYKVDVRSVRTKTYLVEAVSTIDARRKLVYDGGKLIKDVATEEEISDVTIFLEDDNQ